MKRYSVYVRITHWVEVEGTDEDDACAKAEAWTEEKLDELPGAHVSARECTELGS